MTLSAQVAVVPEAASVRAPVALRRPVGRLLGPVGAALLVGIVGLAVAAPLVTRADPRVANGLPYQHPGGAHLLGTDDVGRDLWAQLLYGGRVSLSIGALSALLAVGIGLVVALLAGYHRGRAEAVLLRLVDIALALPFLVLALVLAAFFGRGLTATVVVIGSVIWARPARILLSQVIKVREFPHVTAARAMGGGTPRVLLRHVVPRLLPLLAAQLVRAATIAVLLEASLAFLGLGNPDGVSWGTTLYYANARSAFLTGTWPWWVLPPGIALTLAIVGLAFVGYSVEEIADPRLRSPAPPAPPRRRAPVPTATDFDPAAPVVELRALTVTYATARGPLRAVDGVSMTIGRGQVVGLVGESGSGKSTLAVALLGLGAGGARTGGEVVVAGRPLRRAGLAALRGREIALVPQNAMAALNPAYRVHRQVAEVAALTGADGARRGSELLSLVGLAPAAHEAYPHQLSGGMRQRVVVAMAMVNSPRLLVADEPTTGLDVATQARVLRLLLELRDRTGVAVLLVSHDLPLVGRVADDLVVMYAGRVVESGSASEVLARPRHPYTRALVAAFPDLDAPRKALGSLRGEPPDPLARPVGCPFHPRCPEVVDACRRVEPALVEVAPGHRTACIREQP